MVRYQLDTSPGIGSWVVSDRIGRHGVVEIIESDDGQTQLRFIARINPVHPVDIHWLL